MLPAISIHHQVHQRALEISARYKKSEADLLDVLEQVETHKVYLHLGSSSLFQYGVQNLGLSESVVYNLISVMRKIGEVPQLKIKINSGEINLSNARRIVPVLTQENQVEWLHKASELSQRQLEKEVVKIRPLSAVVEKAIYVAESRVKLEVGLSEKDMIKLRRAQDLLSKARSANASLEDVLIEMTELYLKHKDPVIKAKGVFVKKGFNEPVSIQVQNIPTKREPIPASILHQVNLRDQKTCTFTNASGERCKQSRFTEIHHHVPVSQGGKNTANNLITLCTAHHRWIHAKHV